jgi:oligopeptidase A
MLRRLCLALALLAPASAGQQDPSPIAEQLAEADRAVRAIIERPLEQRTFTNTVRAVDDVQASCFTSARMTGFLGQVSPDPAVREVGQRASLDLSNWFSDLYKNVELYEALARFEPQLEEFQGEDRRYLEVLLRDYRREGMGLDDDARARLTEIDRELTELGQEFRTNIDEDETIVFLSEDECRGVPARFLETLPRSAGLYQVPLKGAAPGYFFGYCEVGLTRCKLSTAYGLRGGSRNVVVLERLLVLRAEKASLLGFPTLAHYVTQTRMAGSPERVWQFYADLRPKLRRKALADLELYTAAKREHTGDPQAKFEAWDTSFYRNWLMRERYAVDTAKVREYFPLENVTEGMFGVYQDLFGIRFTETTDQAGENGSPPLWQADVRLFEVHDVAGGELLGEFFIDLHPRPGKFSHAAQFPLRPRKRWADGSLSLPRVALVCNFTKPTESEPALLSHREVQTFFHEFGHCLHSILTRSEYYEFSGTSVARDFVEAPSQMLENWVWNADVLGRFAKHYASGEPLPRAILEGMVAAKNLGSGLNAEGQVFLGTLDMTYHTDPDGVVDTSAVRRQVYADTRLFPAVENLHGQTSFGHLVGYEAGYYGYLWSLVYAQDMFSRFEQAGIMNAGVGAEYRRKVLARGGSVPALDLVRDFLGREPNSEAFLRALGLE